MKDDLISIIVPCYNVSKYIQDCYISLKNQTYQNFEVIFVNDGSKDDTLQKLETYCCEDSRFKIINQKNQGVSVARNNGISSAQGTFVCFVDSDDAVSPTYLEEMLTVQKQKNYDVVCCDYKYIKQNFNIKKIKKRKIDNKHKTFDDKEKILKKILTNSAFRLVVWNKLYKKSLLEEVEGFPNLFNKNIIYGEDLDLNIRIFKNAKMVAFVRKKLYLYRVVNGGAVRGKFKKELLSVFDVHERCLEFTKDLPELKPYIYANICVSCVEMLFRISKSNYNDEKVVRKLYKDMIENKKYLFSCKDIQWYKKLIPLARPILKMKLNKFLKIKKA